MVSSCAWLWMSDFGHGWSRRVGRRAVQVGLRLASALGGFGVGARQHVHQRAGRVVVSAGGGGGSARRSAAGWQARPTPSAGSVAAGSAAVVGRLVGRRLARSLAARARRRSADSGRLAVRLRPRPAAAGSCGSVAAGGGRRRRRVFRQIGRGDADLGDGCELRRGRQLRLERPAGLRPARAALARHHQPVDEGLRRALIGQRDEQLFDLGVAEMRLHAQVREHHVLERRASPCRRAG